MRGNAASNTSKGGLYFAIFGALAAVLLAATSRAFEDTPKDPVAGNAQKLIEAGRQTFRFDTFGDEAF